MVHRSAKPLAVFTALVLLAGGIAYVLMRTDGLSPLGDEIPLVPTDRKVLRMPLGETVNAGQDGKQLKLYDPLLESWFEGWSRLYYEFAYPESDFIVTTSNANTKVTIEEKNTGRFHTISITNEAGRGYTPMDYWREVLRRDCSDCRLVENAIAIENATGLLTIANDQKEWVIFGSPVGTGWLFVAELVRPASAVELILETFTFISPQENNTRPEPPGRG